MWDTATDSWASVAWPHHLAPLLAHAASALGDHKKQQGSRGRRSPSAVAGGSASGRRAPAGADATELCAWLRRLAMVEKLPRGIARARAQMGARAQIGARMRTHAHLRTGTRTPDTHAIGLGLLFCRSGPWSVAVGSLIPRRQAWRYRRSMCRAFLHAIHPTHNNPTHQQFPY